ncbi:hypothetical protein VPH35_042091 [Triticum aestivum]
MLPWSFPRFDQECPARTAAGGAEVAWSRSQHQRHAFPELEWMHLLLLDLKHYGVNFVVAEATAIEHDFFAKNNLSVDITS